MPLLDAEAVICLCRFCGLRLPSPPFSGSTSLGYALPIAIGVFIGGALLRAIYWVITGNTTQDGLTKR
jgi:hypothetical protein